MTLVRDLLRDITPTACRARAAVGAAAWAVGVGLTEPGWGAALLLLAPLVAIPLGLALLGPQGGILWRVAVLLQLPAAMLLLAGLTLPPGSVAACFTLPWLAVTVLLALVGARRLLRHRPRPVEELCVSAGLLYLAVGGGWTVLTALGARPLDFPAEIVRATAVHFHYAGFVLPVLAARVIGARPARLARVAAVGLIVGVPLVAVGITLSAFGVKLPECLAACVLAVVAAGFALLQLRVALSLSRVSGRLLLAGSSLALLIGMTLAALYAVGNYGGSDWLDIPLMLRTHGVLNAFGFALLGLLAWNLNRG
ncbi:MAG: YndJ family protein [Gemmataceae bacterium]|nr:YndJ family protein [Gemmataceae bacterium]